MSKRKKDTLVKLGITQNKKESRELTNALIKLLPIVLILYLIFEFIRRIISFSLNLTF